RHEFFVFGQFLFQLVELIALILDMAIQAVQFSEQGALFFVGSLYPGFLIFDAFLQALGPFLLLDNLGVHRRFRSQTKPLAKADDQDHGQQADRKIWAAENGSHGSDADESAD
ncbi:MAG: hypothetical protein ACYC2W_12015, partial [Desulfurivibrionaceae bacterium]